MTTPRDAKLAQHRAASADDEVYDPMENRVRERRTPGDTGYSERVDARPQDPHTHQLCEEDGVCVICFGAEHSGCSVAE